MTLDPDMGEGRGGQPHHHAGHAFVADQDVRPTAEQPHRGFLLGTALDQRDKLIEVLRFGKILRRTTQLEPGVHRQRFIPPNDLLETRQ